jgi:hypothetical protein
MGSGSGFGSSWPVAWATTLAAAEFRFLASSNFFLRRRVGMRAISAHADENASGKLKGVFQIETLPIPAFASFLPSV